MILCDKCLKPITGQYTYNPEKKEEGKKFCSTICMHDYYAPDCVQCGKQAPSWVYSADKNDGKKFCTNFCMEQHYRSHNPPKPKDKDQKNDSSGNNFNLGDYKGLIIGAVIIVVLIIILAVVFSQKKRKR